MGDYISVNGVRSYYEEHGEGDPLLLMHGGFCTVEVLSALTAELSKHYRVLVPERRGHGRTPDVEGPYTYERMGEDTIGFMQAMELESAHLVGFSDGANTALVVALERPDLVKSIVSIGGNYHFSGLADQFQAMIEHATPETFFPDLVAAYKQHSPDGPDHFPVVFKKINTMWGSEPKLTTDDIARIAAPTLIISADRDLITLEHTLEMFRAIPKSQLYVVPRANHMSLVGRDAARVAPAILAFLAAA